MSWLGDIFRWSAKVVEDVGVEADKLATEAGAVFQQAHDKYVRSIELYHDKAVQLHDKLYDLAEEADNVRLDVAATESARSMAEKRLEAVKTLIG